MESVFKDNKERIISKSEDITFSTPETGIYLIEISARAKSEKQLKATDDEDLRIEIDKKRFPQLTDKERYFDSPASFSGGTQKGLKKTVYFLISLNQGKHTISLIADSSAILLSINISKVPEDMSISEFDPKINDQAEDGDRRAWITFALVDLALSKFSCQLNLKRRFIDSDDVKVIIDGTVKRNLGNVFRRFWYFIASIFTGENQTETFSVNLPVSLHYIEFWADRIPTLKRISFSGLNSLKSSPTVDDPEWTGNFADDSEQMILARAIFGEARSLEYPDEARIAVGWAIRNRVEDSRWADNYHGIIIQESQYSAFNKDDKNRPYVENPFWKGTETDKNAWYNCYEIAGKVIKGEVNDPTNGANHYYDNSIPTPYWATPGTVVHEVESLNKKSALIFHKL